MNGFGYSWILFSWNINHFICCNLLIIRVQFIWKTCPFISINYKNKPFQWYSGFIHSQTWSAPASFPHSIPLNLEAWSWTCNQNYSSKMEYKVGPVELNVHWKSSFSNVIYVCNCTLFRSGMFKFIKSPLGYWLLQAFTVQNRWHYHEHAR